MATLNEAVKQEKASREQALNNTRTHNARLVVRI